MFTPVFVKGNLRFELGGSRHEYLQQLISATGVSGLEWNSLSATENFGSPVQVDLEIPQDTVFKLRVPGRITREYTTTTETMGIRFEQGELQKKLGDFVTQHGQSTEITRKYPRIPSNTLIQTFPTHALVTADTTANLALSADQALVFDVVNLSPNGALLSTENQMALMMQPGERISLTLQPRGWFPTQVRMQASIQRVTDDIATGSGNLVRYMGVKFGKIDELSKTAFLDLLKDILEQLKQTPTR